MHSTFSSVMNMITDLLQLLRESFSLAMKSRRNIIVFIGFLVLCFCIVFTLRFPDQKQNVEEASRPRYYFQSFLSNYTRASRLSCESTSGGNTKQRSLPQTVTVKYNATPIQNMYVSGFDKLPSACPNKGCGVDLLAVIHSSYSHEDIRTAIRLTWKSFDRLPNVVMVFLLGRSGDDELTSQVTRETEVYGDIVVSRNVDTYDNLTLKSVAMAEWVASHCHRAKFVVKVDDDIFFNVVRLLQFIGQPDVATSSRTFYGALVTDVSPMRNPSSKFFMSVNEYPSESYPDYLSGSFYMFTGDLSRDIFTEAIKQNFFRMEDVFITGFLADHLQAKKINVNGFCSIYSDVSTRISRSSVKLDPCVLRSKFSIHHVQYEDVFGLWNILFGKLHMCN